MNENKKFTPIGDTDEIMDEIKKELRLSDERDDEIVSNDLFISKLEKFTRKYNCFNTNEWLYKPDEISKEEHEMLDDIEHFARACKSYYDRNYIETKSDNSEFAEVYNIKWKETFITLNVLNFQGILYYVERLKPSDINDHSYIDFEDMKNGTFKDNVKLINENLADFYKKVCEFKDLGVPSKYLIEIIKDIYK